MKKVLSDFNFGFTLSPVFNYTAAFLMWWLQMYVTPPDTDIYSIPRVLAPMPQKVGIGSKF